MTAPGANVSVSTVKAINEPVQGLSQRPIRIAVVDDHLQPEFRVRFAVNADHEFSHAHVPKLSRQQRLERLEIHVALERMVVADHAGVAVPPECRLAQLRVRNERRIDGQGDGI